MSDVGTALTIVFALYALGMTVFLILENRRPQATLAWMLIFFTAPVIGAVIYVLFGRERKAFSKQSSLLMQDLTGHARPLLSPVLSMQDAEIARLRPAAIDTHPVGCGLTRRTARRRGCRCQRI